MRLILSLFLEDEQRKQLRKFLIVELLLTICTLLALSFSVNTITITLLWITFIITIALFIKSLLKLINSKSSKTSTASYIAGLCLTIIAMITQFINSIIPDYDLCIDILTFTEYILLELLYIFILKIQLKYSHRTLDTKDKTYEKIAKKHLVLNIAVVTIGLIQILAGQEQQRVGEIKGITLGIASNNSEQQIEEIENPIELSTNYDNFEISNGKQKAIIRKGIKVSGDLPVNSIEAPYGLLEYTVPESEKYTIKNGWKSFSLDTDNIAENICEYTYETYMFGIHIEAKQVGTLEFNSNSEIKTHYPRCIRQTITSTSVFIEKTEAYATGIHHATHDDSSLVGIGIYKRHTYGGCGNN